MKPVVLALCCTYNRHTHLEKVVRCFLDQDYEGEHILLIFNNSPVAQQLADIPLAENKKIILVNRCVNLEGKSFSSVGQIYETALTYVSNEVEVVNIMDDDDIYLPSHLSRGVEGYLKARQRGKEAYKPETSWFRTREGISKAVNVTEPSIFVSLRHLKKYGFHYSSGDQHLRWVDPLIKYHLLYEDPEGVSTHIYHWMGDCFKISGDHSNPNNFQNIRNFPGDTGDGIITPVSAQDILPHYQTK